MTLEDLVGYPLREALSEAENAHLPLEGVDVTCCDRTARMLREQIPLEQRVIAVRDNRFLTAYFQVTLKEQIQSVQTAP